MAPTFTNLPLEIRQKILLEAVLGSRGSHKDLFRILKMENTSGPTELVRTISALSRIKAQITQEMVWVLDQAQKAKTSQILTLKARANEAISYTRRFSRVDPSNPSKLLPVNSLATAADLFFLAYHDQLPKTDLSRAEMRDLLGYAERDYAHANDIETDRLAIERAVKTAKMRLRGHRVVHQLKKPWISLLRGVKRLFAIARRQ